MRVKEVGALGITLVVALLAAPIAWGTPSQSSWTLTGKVISSGNLSPVEGTRLRLIAWPSGQSVAATVSGPDGTFGFSVPGAGTYSVLAQPKDGRYAEKSSALVRLGEAGKTAQVSIQLAPTTTSTRNLNQEQALLEAARIRANLGTKVQESDPANLGLENGSTDIRIISRPPPDIPPKQPPAPPPAPPGTPPGGPTKNGGGGSTTPGNQ